LGNPLRVHLKTVLVIYFKELTHGWNQSHRAEKNLRLRGTKSLIVARCPAWRPQVPLA